MCVSVQLRTWECHASTNMQSERVDGRKVESSNISLTREMQCVRVAYAVCASACTPPRAPIVQRHFQKFPETHFPSLVTHSGLRCDDGLAFFAVAVHVNRGKQRIIAPGEDGDVVAVSALASGR